MPGSVGRHPLPTPTVGGVAYFGGIGFLTLAPPGGAHAWLPAGTAGVFSRCWRLSPDSGVSVSLVNWVVARLVPARTPPPHGFPGGDPPGVPHRGGGAHAPHHAGGRGGVVHTLEVNYQANPDPALTFALLSDFHRRRGGAGPRRRRPSWRRPEADRSPQPPLRRRGPGPFPPPPPGSALEPRRGAMDGVGAEAGEAPELNQPPPGAPLGALGGGGGRARLAGNPSSSPSTPIPLPRDAAARLVGTLAHPLNRPEVGPGGSDPTGYSVLQPRLEILPEPDGARPSAGSSGGCRGWTSMPTPPSTSTRTSSTRGSSRGRGSTTWPPSRRASRAGSRRTPS
jgi:cyclic beta-1,2-glucan synthetase